MKCILITLVNAVENKLVFSVLFVHYSVKMKPTLPLFKEKRIVNDKETLPR